MLRLISAAGIGPVFSSLTRSSLMTTAPPLGKASKDRRSRARFFASSQFVQDHRQEMHVVIPGKLLEEAAGCGLDPVAQAGLCNLSRGNRGHMRQVKHGRTQRPI